MFYVVPGDFDIVPFALPNLDKVPNMFPIFVDDNIEEQLRIMLGDFFYDTFVNALALIPDWTQTVSPDGYAVGAQIALDNDVWESLTADNIVSVIEGVNWHKVETSNRWLLLKNGAPYVYNSYPYTWTGMHTMLVPMIYSLYTAAKVKEQTAIGIVVANSENSEVVSSGDNIVRGWNKFSGFAIGSRGIGAGWRLWGGLFGYLYSNAASFDDLFVGNAYKNMQTYLAIVFQAPMPQNVFDI